MERGLSQPKTGVLSTLGWLDLLWLLSLVGIPTMLYLALVWAPEDAVMAELVYRATGVRDGVAQRIFYTHVPMAMAAYISFFLVFLGSLLYLWRRQIVWDIVARSSAEVGVVFTTLALITGSLWGMPTWGAPWAWDARLTFTLVLWLIYIAYLMLRSAGGGNPARTARYAAVLGIVGFFDIPLIHWAVVIIPEGMHPFIVSESRASLPPEMLFTLIVAILTFAVLALLVIGQRIRLELAREELENLQVAMDRERSAP
ncbi:MAG: cytochrome c biogenesis protein CcsA [Chloroflexi bacterium]|nr:cytochrome c biogenesis protein CcsA [Chloroflexota bacterium]